MPLVSPKYWIHWHTRGEDNLQDHIVMNSSKGEYPFPFEEYTRLDDLNDEIRSLCEMDNDEEHGAPIPFRVIC